MSHRPLSIAYASLAGLAFLFIALGSDRFAYPPLIPLMVSSHWSTVPQAGYIGSANFLGYLLGAWWMPIWARYTKRSWILGVLLVLSVLGIGLCAWNLGFLWFSVWRLIAGFSGGGLMVLVPSLILADVPIRRKGLVSSIMFSGIGLAMVFFSELVPVFNMLGGILWVWAGFGLCTIVMGLIAFRSLTSSDLPLLTPPRCAEQLSSGARRSLIFAGAAYLVYGIAIVPYNLFLADYAREVLHASLSISSFLFSLQGVGCFLGSLMGGWLRNFLGARRALIVMATLSVVSVLILLVIPSAWAVGVSAFLLGFCIVAIVLLVSLCVDEIAGAAQHARYWSYITLCYAAAQLGAGYGFSALLAANLHYIVLFWIALPMSILTLFFFSRMCKSEASQVSEASSVQTP